MCPLQLLLSDPEGLGQARHFLLKDLGPLLQLLGVMLLVAAAAEHMDRMQFVGVAGKQFGVPSLVGVVPFGVVAGTRCDTSHGRLRRVVVGCAAADYGPPLNPRAIRCSPDPFPRSAGAGCDAPWQLWARV